VSGWGLTIPLTGVPLAEHADLVRALPDLGYTDVWSSEVAGADAFTPLAVASQWAPQLRLGTAIVPVYTRGPALIAMSAATLAGLAPGRFVLGIGASSPVIVQDWNGIAYGAILNWLAASDVPRCVEAIGNPDADVVARIFVCPSADVEYARNVGRGLIAAYLTVPAYAAFHDWLGRGPALRELHERWAARDRAGAMAAIPDEVVDALVLHGSPESCREQVREYAKAGVRTPVLAVLPTPEVLADPLDVLRRMGPAA